MLLTNVLLASKFLESAGEKLGRDLTIRQIHILLTIVAAGPEGIDSAKLGEITGTSASAVSRNIRVLGNIHYNRERAGLGLVAVELDQLDNRRRVAKATPLGVVIVDNLCRTLGRDLSSSSK